MRGLGGSLRGVGVRMGRIEIDIGAVMRRGTGTRRMIGVFEWLRMTKVLMDDVSMYGFEKRIGGDCFVCRLP